MGCAAILALAVACSTWQAPADFSTSALRERAQTATSHEIRVSAAVLSAEDRQRMLGVELDKTRVQPVWVEVQNQTGEPLLLLQPGTDPDYFSPLEVAWSMHGTFTPAANARINAHLDQLGFKNPVLPGETKAGVLFINPERATRLLNIDLLQRKTLIPFSLFLRVPDDAGENGLPKACSSIPVPRSRTMTIWPRCVPRWSAFPAAPLTRTAGRTAIRSM